MKTTLINYLKSLFVTTKNTTMLPDISLYQNILFSGFSGTGKTISGCFSEIERAISRKETIYVFCREKEYEFMKTKLLQSNYSVSTISEDVNSFHSHLSTLVHNQSVFYENKVNLFGTDHISIQEQFSTRLLSLCEQAAEQKNPTLILVDGLDFYNLPEAFWQYYDTSKYPYLRFVFTVFSVQDLSDYAQFRHPNYELLLTLGQIVQMGVTSNRAMSDLQKIYQIPYSSVESYLRTQENHEISGWYGVVFYPNNVPQILEKQFLLYPINYAWREFYDSVL